MCPGADNSGPRRFFLRPLIYYKSHGLEGPTLTSGARVNNWEIHPVFKPSNWSFVPRDLSNLGGAAEFRRPKDPWVNAARITPAFRRRGLSGGNVFGQEHRMGNVFYCSRCREAQTDTMTYGACSEEEFCNVRLVFCCGLYEKWRRGRDSNPPRNVVSRRCRSADDT